MLGIMARKSNTVGQTTSSPAYPTGLLMPKQHNPATPLTPSERSTNLPHPHSIPFAASLRAPTPPRPLSDLPNPHPPSVPSRAVRPDTPRPRAMDGHLGAASSGQGGLRATRCGGTVLG